MNKTIINRKYKPLFTNDTRYFILTGGRGSAKSFGAGFFISLLSFEPSHRILYTRQTMTSANISIIPEFQEKINLLQAADDFEVIKNEIVNKQSGSVIIFRGIKTSSGDQTANLKSLQGVTTWIIDEAEELTDERTFDKINLSIRQKGVQNRVIIILNPASKEHWLYKRFYEATGVQPGFNGVHKNTTYIHTTYADNINNLDASFINEVELMRDTNPTKFQHQILGGWLDKSEGVIFTNWITEPFQEITVPIWGQDFGFSVDPTTLVKTSIDKNNKKIYLKEYLYHPKLTTSQIAEFNTLHAGKSLIVADSAEPRLITELKAKDCNVIEAVKGPGSISAGIAIMQDYQLIIDPDSINLIKELNNYVWNDKKSGTPIDMYNHLLDAARYAIQNQLSANRQSWNAAW
jgi:phage terminase large subunit